MRQILAVPISAAVLIASLLAGCGGDDSSDSGTTTTTTGASGSASFCAAYSQVQSDGESIKQLDPANVTVNQVKQEVASLKTSVQALGSAASETAGQTPIDRPVGGEQRRIAARLGGGSARIAATGHARDRNRRVGEFAGPDGK